MPDGITGPTLAEVMARRMLSMDEVMTWAPQIAASIEQLHRQGRSHGAVGAGAVRIDGHRAVLMPGGEGFAAAKHIGDIVQFAALLKAMLRRAAVKTGVERAHWRAFDQIAATNADAPEDSQMKNVTDALRLVCPAPPGREETSDAPPRRVHATVLQVWAVLTAAAGLAITTCVIVVKFVR